MKKLLMFIVVIAMFVLVSCIDTDSSTKESDIQDAKVQAEINIASKGVK